MQHTVVKPLERAHHDGVAAVPVPFEEIDADAIEDNRGENQKAGNPDQRHTHHRREATTLRPVVKGKSFFRGNEQIDIRGVTYGPFSGPDQFREQPIVSRDFAAMRASGINAIRIYTIPPPWLLDEAQAAGLFVMVGLAWEQHVTFLADASLCDDIEQNVRNQVREVAGHPAIFCYIIGNEISSAIVRWHGPEHVERFIQRLFRAVRQEDPKPLITYANFPSTQYLRLPFLDFVSFNVYLENRDEMSRYLASLHHECDDRPLLLTEVGLDSTQNGEDAHADVLRWQIQTAFEAGCCGVVLFSWTDEWTAGGMEITRWSFGLTTRDRDPKPALAAVARAFADIPFPVDTDWPTASVVVCTHDGSRTLGETLDALARLDYPRLEVIVVDDGSTRPVDQIAMRFGVRYIRQDHQGLSTARNTGLAAATGDFIAYLDDDAWPDSRWLKYAVLSLMHSTDAGVGGPNLPCPDDGLVADCVAQSPGNPTHIMLTERIAEHIPGCNMVFKKSALLAVGGFDPQFWIAGDDVDLCWRFHEQGMTLGFSPAAVVWHHRRSTVRAYLRQQTNYGRAEAELERKWPHKYNTPGHLAWVGHIYARGPSLANTAGRRKIFYGTWGAALFQTAHALPASFFAMLPTMPDWYLWMIVLGVFSVLGLFWSPMLLAVPLFAAGLAIKAISVISCFVRHWERSAFYGRDDLVPSTLDRLRSASLTTLLHLLQPLARLWGRTCGGLTPWRWSDVSQVHGIKRIGRFPLSLPTPRTLGFWSEKWEPLPQRLKRIMSAVRETGCGVRSGGSFDRWDLEVRGGVVGAARLWSSIEEHGRGRQLTVIRISPRFRIPTLTAIAVLLGLSVMAAVQRAWLSSSVLALADVLLIYRCIRDSTVAIGTLLAVFAKDPGLGIEVDLKNRLQR